MADDLLFHAWQRSSLFELAQRNGARLSSAIPLILTDTNTGQQTLPGEGDVSFTLMAAGDIAGLKPGAVKHMAPAPMCQDAETTKLVHIDFWERDLPWRYTPEKTPANNTVKPWLVLLVGTSAEIEVKGNIVTRVENAVLLAHPLNQSHLWAHTQFDGNNTISRILSPRQLNAQSEYIAVVVPAFNAAGNPMWNAAGVFDGVLPAFHYWRFWTAEAGDFETLAAALHMPPGGDVGKSQLYYRRKVAGTGINFDLSLEVRGAITSLQQQTTLPKEVVEIHEDLDNLNNAVDDSISLPLYGRPWLPNPDDVAFGWPADINNDPRFRGVAGLGVWTGVEGQEALMDAAVKQAGALREAGQRIGYMALGLWAAGRLWDRRMPTDRNERLRILGPIMSRMIAADGGIVLTRVTSGTSPLPPAAFSSAAQRVLRDRSSATRHLSGANGGINRTEALDAANQPENLPEYAPAGLPHVDAIAAVLGLPGFDDLNRVDTAWLADVMNELMDSVHQVSWEYRRKRDEMREAGDDAEIPLLRNALAEELMAILAEQLQNRLAELGLPCEGWEIINAFDNVYPGGNLEFYGRALEDDYAQDRLYDALWQKILECMAELEPCQQNLEFINWLANRYEQRDLRNIEAFCKDQLEGSAPEPVAEQQPIDLVRLSDGLHAALDPRQPNAPGRLRLCSQITGVDCSRLTRPEFPIGLDFPTWDLLNTYDKEWLLPGASTLEKDSVFALQTNPEFIDAYMLGINTQFMSEMRWRDLAVARTATPLRMFWGQVNYATQKRQADIEPLAEWAKATGDPVGALSHQSIQPDDPANATGSRLVAAFHTDLFRRYPSTLVYLVKPGEKQPAETDAQYTDRVDNLLKAPPILDMPALPEGLSEAAKKAAIDTWRKGRKHFGPIFIGKIMPDLTFFIFDVTPSTLAQYWLVLDEPPAELRFRFKAAVNAVDSAKYAEATIDEPTRVAISGEELFRQANN